MNWVIKQSKETDHNKETLVGTLSTSGVNNSRVMDRQTVKINGRELTSQQTPQSSIPAAKDYRAAAAAAAATLT